MFMIFVLGLLAIILSASFYLKNKKLLVQNSYLKQQIHHRVKNNVQVAYSLISLQKRYINNSESSKELEDTQKRVAALCYVNKLFLTKDMNHKTVASKDFNEQCVKAIFKKHIENNELVGQLSQPLVSKHKFNVIDLDTALPLSLLINEVLLVFFNDKVLTNRFCSFFTCFKNKEFVMSLPKSYEISFREAISNPLHNRVINRLAQQLDVEIKINDKLLTQQV